ncbi:MAG: MBL fold metallo-hydrolase [Candidatus Zixiibacteriota bacterium]
MITLSFHGAAGTVTGSKYLLRVNDHSILIDCGLFQGKKELRQRNWQAPVFNPSDLSAIILTHTHIDHIGYLPKLKREGFSGIIYATPPTIEMAKILLLDSARLNEEDAEYRNRKGLTSHDVALPLFTEYDVESLYPLFRSSEFGEWIQVCPGIRFRYHVVGHILGAASAFVEITDNGKKTTILFSGDVGRYGNPLTIDPAEPPEADYLVCESTYGGKVHPDGNPYDDFAKLIMDTIKHKRVMLIPAFAVGRTQQITWLINRLIEEKKIPVIDIHVDSPMAVSATEIYRKYSSYHRLDPGHIGGEKCCLYGPHVTLHKKRKSSKDLNKLRGPAIIISSSGMMTGGRIMHHLMNRLGNTSTTLAIVGYMAEGTLGRKLLDGEKMVYIHKQPIEVKAKIVTYGGLSGHGDYTELLQWLKPFRTPPRRVFITHGEPAMASAMAEHLSTERQWQCHIPVMDESVEL